MDTKQTTPEISKKLDALQWLERFYAENWHYDRVKDFQYRVLYPNGKIRWIDDLELSEKFRRTAGDTSPPAKAKKKRTPSQQKAKAKRRKKESKRKKAYRAYIHSDQWKEIRNLILKRDHVTCLLCGSTLFLHVHHRHYQTFGNETGRELATLCRGCHSGIHREGWEAAKMVGLVVRDVRESSV